MKNRWYVNLLLMLFLLITMAQAMAQVATKPKTYVDSANNFYIHQSLPFQLYVHPQVGSDSSQSQEGILPHPLNQAENTLAFPEHGIFEVSFRAVGTSGRSASKTYRIHADGLPPVSEAIFREAPVYQKGGQTYYGAGLTIGLQGKDQMSGLEKIFIGLNTETLEGYTQPVQVDKPGEYILRYYANDHVGNIEAMHEESFIIDLLPPSTELVIQGNHEERVLAPTAKLALHAEDEGAGIKNIEYRLDDGNWIIYTNQAISLSGLPDGMHTCTFRATDKVENQSPEEQFNFYLDKIPPFVKYKVIGEQYRGNKLYVAPTARIELMSVDNHSGVEEIFYRVNGKEEQLYSTPIALENSSGQYQLSMYAVDKMGNTSKGSITKFSVFFDDKPPVLEHQFKGAYFFSMDSAYITSNTLVQLTAVDHDAGLKQVNWELDQGQEKGEGIEPFSVATEGVHQLLIEAIDHVGNRMTDSIVFVVDNTPPVLNYTLSTQDLGTKLIDEIAYTIIPSECQIYLSATDRKTGVNEIYYALNAGKEQLFRKPLQGFQSGEVLELSIKATDQLGNAFQDSVKLVVGN